MAESQRGKGGTVYVFVLYIVGVVVLIAAAIIPNLVLRQGPFFWPLTLIGAAVISTLLSAVAFPYLRKR